MVEAFVTGWAVSCGWCILIVPIIVIKAAFRMSVD